MSYELARDLVQEEMWPDALRVLDPLMEAEPESPLGLFLFGQVMLGSEKPAIALTIFKRVTELETKRPEGWINYGKSAGELHLYDLEEKYFRKALSLSKKGDLPYYLATRNLGTAATHTCNPDKAIHWARKALKIKENSQSHIDLGFAYLMKFDFKNGWKEYEYGNGVHKHRSIKQYADEPRWNGDPDQCVVIYGEQGIGDQLCFAEAARDARKISKQVILHVNPKIKNLLARSLLLETHSYGDDDNRAWVQDRRIPISASCSMSMLQTLFRSGGYSGTPHLVADPQRRVQWKALIHSLGDKLKVGIAWTGGVHDTQQSARSTTLNELLPLLKQDVTWISLEYKDRTEEIAAFQKERGIKIYDFPWATQTNDYDDTAALVAELDLVISVPTSIVHLAGGLGVECWCMVHPFPHFMFGLKGNSMPYYNSVKLFRREKDFSLEKIGTELDEMRRLYSGRAESRSDTQSSGGISPNSHLRQRAIFHNQHPDSG